MKAETNKQVMQRFTEFINSASEKLANELISPKAIFYVPGQAEPMRGPAGYLAIIGMMRGGFPDIQWTLEEMIAEDDKVAARFTMRGTHQGTFFGVPPSGKVIQVQAMNFYRLSDGQFIEERGQPDLLGLCNRLAQFRWRERGRSNILLNLDPPSANGHVASHRVTTSNTKGGVRVAGRAARRCMIAERDLYNRIDRNHRRVNRIEQQEGVFPRPRVS